MIILKPKDMDKLKAKAGKNNILITCGLCPPWNFPKGEIDAMGKGLNARVVKAPTLCNYPKIEAGGKYDRVFVLACGAGVQVVSEVLNSEVIPVADTMGLGVKSDGKILNYCSACKNCILDETAGICPITRCAKSLRNGPCGGVHDGQCELEDRECVWIHIYEKMKESGKLVDFANVFAR